MAQESAPIEPTTVPAGGEPPLTISSEVIPQTTGSSIEETATYPLCYKLNEVLAKIAEARGATVCSLNSVCNGLVCNFTAFSMNLWVVPCSNPPVIRMAILDSRGEKLFDDVVKESLAIEGQNYSIGVVIDRQEGQFGLQVVDLMCEVMYIARVM